MKIVKKYYERLKYAYKVFNLKGDRLHSLSDEGFLRGSIASSIASSKLFKPQNPQEEFQIQNLIDQIASDILNAESREANFIKTVDHHFYHQMWFYSIVAGYACLWEFKVKLLAEHLGIDIKKPFEDRSSKHKKAKIMTYRDLKEIIPDLNVKINKQFDLQLKSLSELRSALVHGNFDQLRILANNCKHKYKATNKGNVIVFSLSDQKSFTNLSDDLPRELREGQSLFAWFTEVTNTMLMKEIWALLDESISKMNAIVSLNANSFDGREKFFRKVVFEGEKISIEMINAYDGSFIPLDDYKKYFKRLNHLFGPKIFDPNALEKINTF